MDSIQDTAELSQDIVVFIQYKSYEVGLDLKIKLEHLKLETKIS